MGKKKKQKHSQSDYRRGLESQFYGPTGGEATKVLERYGLDRKDYASEGAIGQGRVHGKGSFDDMETELLRRASNDYDTRRALEASAMSGNKKAEKFAKNGIGNIKDLMRVNKLQEKQHKKMGNGGNFSSASDFAGLSYGMVKKDREAQTAGYREEFASKADLDELRQQQAAQPEEEEYTPSPELSKAKSVVDAYESGIYDKGVYGFAGDDEQSSTAVSPYETSSSGEKAQSYLDQFKTKLKERKNFQPAI